MDSIPYGKCLCGCGQDVGIAVYTNPERGWIAGQPKRYVRFHHRKGQKQLGRDDATEFWNRTNRVGQCLLWTGALKPGGYGNAYYGGKMQGAHRVAFILAHGPIPPGMDVCHSCDCFYAPGDITYRKCVDETHLFLGTRTVNMQDALHKGRMPTGGAKVDSLFSDDQVLVLREEFTRWRGTLRSFADARQINRITLLRILRGDSYKYVGGPLYTGHRQRVFDLLDSGNA